MTSGGTGPGDTGHFGAGDDRSGSEPTAYGAPYGAAGSDSPIPGPSSGGFAAPSSGGFSAVPMSSYGSQPYGSQPTGAQPYGSYGTPGSGQSGAHEAYGSTPTAPYGATTHSVAQPYPTTDPYGVTPPPGGGGRKSGGRVAGLAAGAVVLALVAGGVGGVVGSKISDGDSGSSTSSRGPIGGDRNGGNAPAPAPAPAGSVQGVAAAVLPSVVSLDVTDGTQAGEGSGVILTDDGVIMTNNHVISAGGSRPGQVVVNFNDGSRAPAKVVGFDRISDIAVIKVERRNLQAINVGTSKNLAVGQDVIAVGAPLGLQGTVTTGIISALNRPVSTSRESGTTSVIDAIQTDAAINPGNSGGALVNAKGALIGINTAIATLGGGGAGAGSPTGSIGLGFAIPIDQAMRVADELRKTGKATQAGLGVSVRSSPTAQQPGAEISTVTPNGPAAKAGIPVGAIVTRVDDRTIATGDALVAAVRSHAPGDTIAITFVHDGDSRTVQVTLETLQTS